MVPDSTLETVERRDEAWAEQHGSWQLDSESLHARNAVAPAEAAGQDKFDGMFRRDSPDVAWKVAFKTMRKSRTGDARLPSGFPQLWTFFHEAVSLRVFKWGFRKYQELYPDDDAWTQWIDRPGSMAEWHPQKLRVAMYTHCDRVQRGVIKESTKKPYRLSKVQRQILAWTILVGLWNDPHAIEAAPPVIRAIRNWNRVRAGVRAIAFVAHVKTMAASRKRPRSPSLAEHDVCGRGEECISPSLKRICV